MSKLTASAPDTIARSRDRWLWALVIVAATFIAYWPSLAGGFIWDDQGLIAQNRLIHAADGWYRLWITTDQIDYWPITYDMFWLEWRLWGANTLGYHLVNVSLHICCALLIWKILTRLRIPGGALAAIVFALHPVNVASVAWISERKNIVALLFFLLAILCYLRFVDVPANKWKFYLVSLFAFALGMLSKGSIAILPIVLLLILWRRRPIKPRDLIDMVPFFIVSAALVLVNIWFQTHGNGQKIRDVTLLQRLLGAGAVVWFYLYKALLPLRLDFVYPQWNISPRDPRWWMPLLACLIVTCILLWQRRRRPGALLAWLFFCVALIPVMGFVDVYFMRFSLVADYYQYIAIIAPIALICAAITQRPPNSAGKIAIAIIVIFLGFLTWRQSGMYVDAKTLYAKTLQSNPDCSMADLNLGVILHQEHDNDRAYAHFAHALQLNPNDPLAHTDLGNLLGDTGKLDQAVQEYQRALQIEPNNPKTMENLGIALAKLGRTSDAIAVLQNALKLQPDEPTLHYSMAYALAQSNHLDDAIAQYEQALPLDPENAQAEDRLGYLLEQAGRGNKAMGHYLKATQIEPTYAPAHNHLGSLLAASGNAGEALREFSQAVRLQPDLYDAWMNLAALYAQNNRLQDAIAAAEQALAAANAANDRSAASAIQLWIEKQRQAATPQ
jgi:tetratricopeptide (TPR) repeat protein